MGQHSAPKFDRSAALNARIITGASVNAIRPYTTEQTAPESEFSGAVLRHWGTHVYVGVDFAQIRTPNHALEAERDSFNVGCAFIQCCFRPGTMFGDGCEFGANTVIPANCSLGDECVLRRGCHLSQGCELGLDCELGVQTTYDCEIPESAMFVRRQSSQVWQERKQSIRATRHGVLPAHITSGRVAIASKLTTNEQGQIVLEDTQEIAKRLQETYKKSAVTSIKPPFSHPMLQNLPGLRQKASLRDAAPNVNSAAGGTVLTSDLLARVIDVAGTPMLQVLKIESKLSVLCQNPLLGDERAQQIIADAVLDGLQKQLDEGLTRSQSRQALLAAFDGKELLFTGGDMVHVPDVEPEENED